MFDMEERSIWYWLCNIFLITCDLHGLILKNKSKCCAFISYEIRWNTKVTDSALTSNMLGFSTELQNRQKEKFLYCYTTFQSTGNPSDSWFILSVLVSIEVRGKNGNRKLFKHPQLNEGINFVTANDVKIHSFFF